MLDRADISRPVYEQLREYFLRDIQNGKLLPGDKISPEHELADRFRVSRTTIRRALHGLEKEGLILRFPGKGTFISCGSSSVEPSFTVGINFLSQITRSDPYYARLADGVLREAGKHNIQVQILPRGAEEEELFEKLSGVLYVGTPDRKSLLYKKISKGILPSVGFNSRLSTVCNYVGVDNELEVKKAVSTLIGHGYRSIGYYGSSPEKHGSIAEKRFRGYCKALEQNSLAVKQEHLFFCNEKGDRYTQSVEFLQKAAPEMDALFVSLSPVLPDLLYAMNVLRISVQEDLKILCFDDLESRHLNWPEISYIKVPLEEIGSRMMFLLYQQMILKEKSPVVREIFQAELVNL